MAETGQISGAVAKEVLAQMVQRGGQPAEIVAKLGLGAPSDAAAIEKLVTEAVAGNAAKAAEYRAGRTGLLGFFVGVVVKASRGTADPQVVKDLLAKHLG